jgi:cytochrome c-type biogenesis protein CcmF
VSIGSLFLGIAAIGAVVAVAVSAANLAGARLPRRLALAASLLAGLAAVVAFVFLVSIFVHTDLSYRIVVDFSSKDMPWVYKVSGSWAGQAGSMVLWSGLLLGAWAIEEARWGLRARRGKLPSEQKVEKEAPSKGPRKTKRGRRVSKQQRRASALRAERPKESGQSPESWRTLELTRLVVMLFALALLASTMLLKPFETLPAAELPEMGNGLNPTLRTPLMAVHPPIVFAGYALAAIPFAAALAYAVLRDRRWVDISRPWTRLGWLMLTLGIGIGGMWAYDTLGWGGYWAWDPVETSSLVPWIALTAFMHAQVGFQRDGQYKHLLPILGGLTVVFILLATFVTRSGVWSSLHAYAGASSAGVGERIRAALAGSSSLRVLYYTMWSVLVATLAIPVGRLVRTKEEEPIMPSRKEGVTTREYVTGGRFTSWATMIATVVALSFMMLLVVTVLARSVSSSVSPSDYHRFVLPLVVLAALVMMVCLPMRSLGLRRALLAAAATLVAGALVAVADPGGAGAVPWLMGVVGLAAVATVAASGAARTWKLRRSPGPAVERAGSTLLHMGIAMIVLAYGFSNVSDNPQESVDLQAVSDAASLAGYKVSITDRSWHPDTGFLARGEYWDSFRGTLVVDRGGTTVQREDVDVTLRWQYRAYGTFTSNGTGAPVSIDGEVVASSFDGGHYLVRVENATNPEQSAVLDLSDRVHTSVSPWPAVERHAGFLVGQYVKVTNATRTWSGFLVGVAPAGGPVTLSTSAGQVVLPRSDVSTFSRRAYIGVVISEVVIHRNAVEDLYVTVTDAHPVSGGGFAASVLVKRIPGMAILWWGMYIAAAGVFLRFLSGAVRGRGPAKGDAEGEAPAEEGAERPLAKEGEASFDEWWERKLGEGGDD